MIINFLWRSQTYKIYFIKLTIHFSKQKSIKHIHIKIFIEFRDSQAPRTLYVFMNFRLRMLDLDNYRTKF